MVYDERLDGYEAPEYDSTNDVMNKSEELAEEMGEEHPPNNVCSACIMDTPLSGENGQWLPYKSRFDSLTDATETLVEEQGEDPYWVAQELSDTYFRTMHEEAPEPDDCEMCTRWLISEDDDCGHEMNGEECPVDG